MILNHPMIREWITALTSGEYQQGSGYLRTALGYCCLGVFCDIAGDGMWVDNGGRATGDFFVYAAADGSRWGGTLPPELAKKSGLPHWLQQKLAVLNDMLSGYTFEEIADVLELVLCMDEDDCLPQS